jgi:hypothetical protein
MVNLRNGLPIRSLGDKTYKSPEYSPDFYKTDGVTIGSTHSLRKNPSLNRLTSSDFALLQSYSSFSPNRTLWKDRVRAEQLAEEIAEVEALPKVVEV